MSKTKKNYGWLTNKPNSAKTLIEQAKREVPDFKAHFAKFEEQMTIGGYSGSTLFSYSRAVAKVSLYFKKSLLELDTDEVNQFLYTIAKEKTASSTYFKHKFMGFASFSGCMARKTGCSSYRPLRMTASFRLFYQQKS